jgi:glycosyltransferase involved in cell wall biosynthesis
MTITVAIPTFNSAKTIDLTLKSVLRQTLKADEILVVDDGSTDRTREILESYGTVLKVIYKANEGVASARNLLSSEAEGDLVAFLDHDDLWNERYLETQALQIEMHPEAAAGYVGHVNFKGGGDYPWQIGGNELDVQPEVIAPVEFMRRYNSSTGTFGSMSFCAVPKRILRALGKEPFRVSGVDDSYLACQLTLLGPIVFCPARLAAYRITEDAQSEDRLQAVGLWVQAFDLLAPRFAGIADGRMRHAFFGASASKRRQFAKLLLREGRGPEARRHLRASIRDYANAESIMKSIALYGFSLFPKRFQSRWPSRWRSDDLC